MDYKWVQSSAYSSIPPDAVIGGNDVDGAMMYVGRSYHNGDQLVAKIIPSKQSAYVSWSGEEIRKEHFEVLCGKNLAWVHCYDHVIPENAILCGRTNLDQPIYIGRGYHEGSLTVGKISSVHRSLFIPFQGRECRLETYEILIGQNVEEKPWMKMASTDPLPPPPPFMLSYEKGYYEAQEQKAGLYPEASAPSPLPTAMPMPHDPPPPYGAASFMPTPMPMPAQSYTPASVTPGGGAYGPPPPSYTPPCSLPESKSTITVISPAELYPTKPSYVQVLPTKPPNQYTPAETYMPAASSMPGGSSYVPAATYVPPPSNYCPPPSAHDIWVPANPSYTPTNAVHAGNDVDLSTIFVCRAFHNGALIPGKVVPNRGCAYIPTDGMEISKTHYEILMGNEKYIWVPARDGHIAPGAVEGGRTNTGEPLYIGRAHHGGSLMSGKIQRSHHCLYICFGGSEHRISHHYEVLVRRDEFYRYQSGAMSY